MVKDFVYCYSNNLFWHFLLLHFINTQIKLYFDEWWFCLPCKIEEFFCPGSLLSVLC